MQGILENFELTDEENKVFQLKSSIIKKIPDICTAVLEKFITNFKNSLNIFLESNTHAG